MENTQQDSLEMQLDYDGGRILRETVRWSRFLSIVGIVGLSIAILVIALAGSALLAVFTKYWPSLEALVGLGAAILIAVILVVLAIFSYVVFMLYRFSTLTRKGIDHQDPIAFAEGMRCLKIYFVISGIFAILGLLGNLASLTKAFF